MEALRQNRYCTRKAARAPAADSPGIASGPRWIPMIDRRLLDVLCCPATRTPVRVLAANELDALNRAIAAGAVRTQSGVTLTAAVTAGVISRDSRTIYRIEDDIPVMLVDEGIATTQIADFPRV
jgi:uncharacterized protein YbaR (Trm112 family)